MTLGVPVGELKQKITYEEFRKYVAYWNLEPFGDSTRYMAQIAWMIYVANGGQRNKQLKVEDFMPKLARPSTGNEAADWLIEWAESFEKNGGKG